MKSIKNISAYIAAGIVLSLCWNFFLNNWTAEILFENFKLSFVGEMLNFQMFGLPMFSSTGVIWYFSAMYIGMSVVTLVFHHTKEKFPAISLALIVLFLYGWLNIKRGGLHDPGFWLGHAFVGTLRGIAGISLGVLCYKSTDFLKNACFNIRGRIFLSLVEVFCYFIAVFYMWKSPPSFWDFYIVLLLFVGVSISLSELSLFSLMNHRSFPFFRKASICILFSHFYVCVYFEKNFPQFEGLIGKTLVLMQVIFLSVSNYLLAKLIQSFASKCISFITIKENGKIV